VWSTPSGYCLYEAPGCILPQPLSLMRGGKDQDSVLDELQNATINP
jgi:hypothetical protein